MVKTLSLMSLLAVTSLAQGAVEERLGIVNGETVGANEPIFKAIVKLSGEGTCSGTLLSPTVVLTASHCTMAGVGAVGTIVNSYAGGAQSCNKAEVQDVFYMPGAKEVEGPAMNPDLALIKLKTPICGIQPAKVTDYVWPKQNLPARTAGFGLGTKSATAADRIDIKFADFTKENFWNEIKDHLDKFVGESDGTSPEENRNTFEKQIAEYVEENKTTAGLAFPVVKESSFCFGDSGGPTYKERDGVAYVFAVNMAIMMHPVKGAPGCENAYFHLVAALKPYNDIIRKKVANW